MKTSVEVYLYSLKKKRTGTGFGTKLRYKVDTEQIQWTPIFSWQPRWLVILSHNPVWWNNFPTMEKWWKTCFMRRLLKKLGYLLQLWFHKHVRAVLLRENNQQQAVELKWTHCSYSKVDYFPIAWVIFIPLIPQTIAHSNNFAFIK